MGRSLLKSLEFAMLAIGLLCIFLIGWQFLDKNSMNRMATNSTIFFHWKIRYYSWNSSFGLILQPDLPPSPRMNRFGFSLASFFPSIHLVGMEQQECRILRGFWSEPGCGDGFQRPENPRWLLTVEAFLLDKINSKMLKSYLIEG